MRFSTKGRYGIRILLDLALHRDEGLVLLKDIARREEISLSYLEHLIGPLIAGGVIKSTRGPRGGVSLLKRPEETKLSEVIHLLEGSTAPVACVDNPEAYPHSDICVTHDIWVEIKKATNGVLESTTLKDLIERRQQKLSAKKLKDDEKQCSSESDASLTDQV